MPSSSNKATSNSRALRELTALALLLFAASCARVPPPAPPAPPTALAPPPAVTAPAAQPAPPSVSGIWLATLGDGPNGGARVQIRLDLSKTPAGCSIDDIDRDVFGIGCTAMVTGASLSVDVPTMDGTLAGTVSDDGNTIQATYTWKHGGEPHPLAFTRQASAIEMPADEIAARKLDAPHRQALLDGIARQLQAHYVLPAVGRKMIASLRAHAAHGDYDAITDGGTFVETVTKDLVDVSHDRHLRCIFGRKPPPAPPAGDLRAQQDLRAQTLAEHRKLNFGFGTIERLDGNVARVAIWGFLPLDDDLREGIARLMAQVADADALVVDLRENQGGEPHTLALVASYLFDAKPVHINDLLFADKHSTEQFWTLRNVKGARFGGKKPVYVLASHATVSGGEELAYDLQSLHRAPVIGETTAGWAHPSEVLDLDDWFHINMPRGRPINPVTKTDWEGVGVKPDVAVPANAALEEALRLARRDIAKTRVTAPSAR
jgi:hypothetical protein